MFSDEAKLKLLMEALNIYSPTGGEHELAEFLVELMTMNGFEAKIDEVGNVIAVKGSGEPVLWLHAHMDTVPGFIEVRREGSKVIGRGASDDKGPLMAMVIAFMESELSRGTLVLTAVVHEEGDSLGTRHLMVSNHVPRPTGIIVGEPTGIDKVVTKYRGGTKLEVSVRTKGGHASNPDLDSNSILIAMNVYRDLWNALMAGTSYENFLVTPTIMNCGEAENMIPSNCRLILDVRIPPGRSCKDVENAINQLRTKYGEFVAINMRWCTEPVEVPVNNASARAVSRAIIKVLGRGPTLARKWGTSDMNDLASLTRNIVAYGPGDGAFSHSLEEYVLIDDYLRAIDIYKQAVVEFMNIYK
ncbi:M20/M25/M40 family metallo-hydrolase [Vulcanisaeta distributa]|uniref:Putative [LysW]-lysine/[LysW]-ornithine hydrolase n=1 Tax=Vulcanisaeta distributa (strain DSM 14429 / JCM 11212 / NBRC 100878 / IC-017) TaxID=572478 RepID=E1QSU5_VULDI|nr:M20/M25/M40 family metallo-hydrolase [Vulcanisaeta distributa]ADN49612.1 N-acetyl-ornithine/N-acetyl-lysine deacetylase [Vulcanisaeta distributa DSM 14429]